MVKWITAFFILLISVAAYLYLMPRDIGWISGFWKYERRENETTTQYPLNTLKFDELYVVINGETKCDYKADWAGRVAISCVHPSGEVRSLLLTLDRQQQRLTTEDGVSFIRF